jgi:BioD-like phosphotransacetylase family protein
VLLVRTDTRTTIDRLEARLRSGRVQRPETVQRMAELLDESIDIDGLLAPS